MKIILRRGLTTLMCMGALIAGTQSWAAFDDKHPHLNSTSPVTKSDGKNLQKEQPGSAAKTPEQCQKPCVTNHAKDQHKHMQHAHHTSSNVSPMDHSMMDMDHSMHGMNHAKTEHTDSSH